MSSTKHNSDNRRSRKSSKKGRRTKQISAASRLGWERRRLREEAVRRLIMVEFQLQLEEERVPERDRRCSDSYRAVANDWSAAFTNWVVTHGRTRVDMALCSRIENPPPAETLSQLFYWQALDRSATWPFTAGLLNVLEPSYNEWWDVMSQMVGLKTEVEIGY